MEEIKKRIKGIKEVRVFKKKKKRIGIRGEGNGMKLDIVGGEYEKIKNEEKEVVEEMEKEKRLVKKRMQVEKKKEKIQVEIKRESD